MIFSPGLALYDSSTGMNSGISSNSSPASSEYSRSSFKEVKIFLLSFKTSLFTLILNASEVALTYAEVACDGSNKLILPWANSTKL